MQKNNKNAIINLSIALQKMGRIDEAILILKEWGEFDYLYTRAYLMLENGKKQIEDSINLYEEGIILAKNCYSLLKEAEIKITELKKQLDIQIK